MAVSHGTIKLLWGRAAGRCSANGCHVDLTTVGTSIEAIGEMAHIIARSSKGPRGRPEGGGSDEYDNLILLCPSCHSRIDKNPADYPDWQLLEWKKVWEDEVSRCSKRIQNRDELFEEIRKISIPCRNLLEDLGPASDRANMIPQSERPVDQWHIKRDHVIIPGNRKISALLQENKSLLTSVEWAIASKFLNHTEAYEEHLISPADTSSYVPFPEEFGAMIDSGPNVVRSDDLPKHDQIERFIESLRRHNKVCNATYGSHRSMVVVELNDGRSLNVFCTNAYVVGRVEVHDSRVSVPEIDAIVTLSLWNSVSHEGRDEGRKYNIGVFTGREFFGAINYAKFYLYRPLPDGLKPVELEVEKNRRRNEWN